MTVLGRVARTKGTNRGAAALLRRTADGFVAALANATGNWVEPAAGTSDAIARAALEVWSADPQAAFARAARALAQGDARRPREDEPDVWKDVRSGASLTLLEVADSTLTVHTLGDNALLLVRRGSFVPLTEPHTLSSQLIRDERLNPMERGPAGRGLTMRYLGEDPQGHHDTTEVAALEPGDNVLLLPCGLWEGRLKALRKAGRKSSVDAVIAAIDRGLKHRHYGHAHVVLRCA